MGVYHEPSAAYIRPLMWHRAYYEVPQMDVVESALQSCLVEGRHSAYTLSLLFRQCEVRMRCTTALCVEITQGVIRDVSDVLVWLKMTFFYIRLVIFLLRVL